MVVLLVLVPFGCSDDDSADGSSTGSSESVASSDSTASGSSESNSSSAASSESSLSSSSAAPSSETKVLSYDFEASSNSGLSTDVTGSIYIVGESKIPAQNTISLHLPSGVDKSSLTATFTLSGGATAVIDGVTQVSGTTVNNYSSNLTMTVTAEDGTTTADYVIMVSQDVPAPM